MLIKEGYRKYEVKKEMLVKNELPKSYIFSPLVKFSKECFKKILPYFLTSWMLLFKVKVFLKSINHFLSNYFSTNSQFYHKKSLYTFIGSSALTATQQVANRQNHAYEKQEISLISSAYQKLVSPE